MALTYISHSSGFQGGTSFVDHLCYLCLVFVMLLHLFIVALWAPDGKGMTSWISFAFVTFPCDILGQVWFLIVSNSDLCPISYFVINRLSVFLFKYSKIVCFKAD